MSNKSPLHSDMEKRASVQGHSRTGSTHSQWAFALLANAITMSYGLECGWISPITQILQTDASPIGAPLTENEVSLIASSMSMTAVLAVPLSAYIVERYGSRFGVILLVIPQTFSWALRIIYSTGTTLLIARIFAGISAGGLFNVIPIYVKEISEDQMRGILGSLLILTQNTGIFLMYIMRAYLDYYIVLYISMCLPIVTGLLMLTSPNSPAFLVKEGKIEEAADSIGLLRGLKRDDKMVQLELESLRKENDKYKEMPDITFKAMYKAWRRGYIFIFLIFSFHGLNGAYTVVTYASAILTSTGVEMDISPELQTLSIPLVMIISSLILTFIVEICGRKWLLAGSFFISSVSMATLAAAVLILRAGGHVPGWVPILAMIFIVSMYAIGVSPLPYIMMTEMFSFQVRNKVSGTIVSYAWFLSFLSVAIYVPITSAFGQYTTFLLHAVLNIVGAVFVAVFVPETKGKDDDEIRRILAGIDKEVTST